MLNNWYVWIVAGLLLAITAGFLVRFVWPALRLRREFGAVIAALRQLGAEAPGSFALREHITSGVMAQRSFAHLWSEYAQTLHAQQTAGGEGMRWRATALAESFFTDQALVDTPLKTEYYKHLPGIMTGLGIIGTFAGLINGLTHFDVSIDPAQAQAQLRALINAVGHAFIVSAIAITLAMIFTWVEKSLVTACYRLTEHIRQEIDSLFDTGADVEYLERLVAAAENSACEVRQFKDALAEQTQLQIAAGERHSARISSDLARLLAGSLTQPMTDIATAVNVVGARQDEVVTRMIGEALNGFSRQMENMFAGQMRDLHEVLKSTNGAMREMVEQFSVMAGRMDAAGEEAVDAMSARVEESFAVGEQRQLAMQRQASLHAEQMLALIGRAQTESGAMQQQLQSRLGQAVEESVGGISGQIEKLVAMSVATQNRLAETVDSLARGSGEHIRQMNRGVEQLGTAAASFAAAGTEVAATLGESARVAAEIRLAADSMRDSAQAAHHMLGDYGQAHDAFARLVSDLKDTVARARREASLSAELTDRLEAAAARLGKAQQQADRYLEGVSKVLGHAHQAFADSVERTLREANRQFQGELSQAVGLLSGAIVDLGNTVEALAEQDLAPARKTGTI